MKSNDLSLLYIMDAYCGWCYGFSASLSAFHKNRPEFPIQVISGGLFTGERALPIRNYPHIPEANQRISNMTGAVFGEKYWDLVAEGSMVLDSEKAAIGFAALRSIDPARSLEFLSAMQHAFYYEGKSLNDETTYLDIAKAMGLEPEIVKKKWKDESTIASAHHDFLKTRQLKVGGFPTLLLKKGDEYTYLGGAKLKPEEIEAKIRSFS